MSSEKVLPKQNWIDGIEFRRDYPPREYYVRLRSLREGDSMLQVRIEGREVFGVYGGVEISQIREKAKGHVRIELGDGGQLNVQGTVTRVSGHRYRLTLSDSIDSFEVLGSIADELAERQREVGKESLVEKYAARRKSQS